ncbi:helix-turn-helix domain-containing protein [Pseudomonas oryzihabitans]|uniref:helix-turn-helix domain-containing protein n=1 Tax=Pseudomonas oryzihabitans TaxID=47885 RepID=UPI0028544298|nr:helix-turn-helix domain-containing protein [Pseudomonas psychrotolerans]MDR6679863.1 AraC-like DNA-binding protein [Pseudomonas psychrotolerans]
MMLLIDLTTKGIDTMEVSCELDKDHQGSNGSSKGLRLERLIIETAKPQSLIWRMAIDSLFDVTPRVGAEFSARSTIYHFNCLLLCDGESSAARYRRSLERLRRCDLDHYILHVPLQGRVAFGKGLRIRPLDVVVLDLTQPASFLMAGRGISLLIPRVVLPSLLVESELHGLVLRRETPSGGLLAQLFSALAASAPLLEPEEALRLASPVLGMIAACLTQAVSRNLTARRAARGGLGCQVRLYIERNLQREGLTAALLAKELGTSRSQLYRAFDRLGGVHHYIRQRRLRRCLLALGDPAQAKRRIADLAYEQGFSDEAHFSRLFRQTFGVSPRAARAALQRGDPAALSGLAPSTPGSATAGLAQWLQGLMHG